MLGFKFQIQIPYYQTSNILKSHRTHQIRNSQLDGYHAALSAVLETVRWNSQRALWVQASSSIPSLNPSKRPHQPTHTHIHLIHPYSCKVCCYYSRNLAAPWEQLLLQPGENGAREIVDLSGLARSPMLHPSLQSFTHHWGCRRTLLSWCIYVTVGR